MLSIENHISLTSLKGHEDALMAFTTCHDQAIDLNLAKFYLPEDFTAIIQTSSTMEHSTTYMVLDGLFNFIFI